MDDGSKSTSLLNKVSLNLASRSFTDECVEAGFILGKSVSLISATATQIRIKPARLFPSHQEQTTNIRT